MINLMAQAIAEMSEADRRALVRALERRGVVLPPSNSWTIAIGDVEPQVVEKTYWPRSDSGRWNGRYEGR